MERPWLRRTTRRSQRFRGVMVEINRSGSSHPSSLATSRKRPASTHNSGFSVNPRPRQYGRNSLDSSGGPQTRSSARAALFSLFRRSCPRHRADRRSASTAGHPGVSIIRSSRSARVNRRSDTLEGCCRRWRRTAARQGDTGGSAATTTATPSPTTRTTRKAAVLCVLQSTRCSTGSILFSLKLNRVVGLRAAGSIHARRPRARHAAARRGCPRSS